MFQSATILAIYLVSYNNIIAARCTLIGLAAFQRINIPVVYSVDGTGFN
jgi:hypothetical protein